jgi:HK97 family phage major capsid protein
LGNQFIDILRSKLIVRSLGARVLSGLVGNVDIPKLQASATAAWVAENAAIGATDPQLTQVQLTPRHVGARTEFSRNMLLQSSPDVEALLRDDFAAILARAVDRAAINGGAANEPTGVLGTVGINTVTFAGTAPTWEEILEFIEEIEIDNSEGTGWATHPSMVKILRSTPKAVAQLWDGGPATEPVSADFLMDGPGNLAGYPLQSSTVVPVNLGMGLDEVALIFGKWSDLLLGYWSAFDVLVNPYESTAYSRGNVQVRGMVTMDVAVRHPESFCAGQLAI